MINGVTLAFIEELVQQISANAGKPSYSYGYSSSAVVGTWLEHTSGVVSNKTGLPFGLDNGRLVELWVGNERLTSFDISVYWHEGDETNLTLLKTVTVPNTSRTKIFGVAELGTVIVPPNVQIAIQVSAVPGTTPRNLAVHATITGTT